MGTHEQGNEILPSIFAMNVRTLVAVVFCVTFAPAPADAGAANALECIVCEKIISYIEEGVITSNSSAQHALADVQAFCDMLPGQLGKDCNTTATNLIDPILGEIGNGVPPQDVCGNEPVNVCSGSDNEALASAIARNHAKTRAAVSNKSRAMLSLPLR